MLCTKKKFILFLILILFYCSLSDAQTSDLKIFLNSKVGDVKKIGLGQIYTTKQKIIGKEKNFVLKEFRLVWLNSRDVVLPFEGYDKDKSYYEAITYNDNHDFYESRAINVGFLGADLIQNPPKEYKEIDNKNYTYPDKLYFVIPDTTKEVGIKEIFIQLLNDNKITVSQGSKKDLEWVVVNIKDNQVESILKKEFIPNHTRFLFILQNTAVVKELPEFINDSNIYSRGRLLPQIQMFYADITKGPILPSKIIKKIKEKENNMDNFYLWVSNGETKYSGTKEKEEYLLRLISEIPPEEATNIFIHEFTELRKNGISELKIQKNQNNFLVYHVFLSELTFRWIKDREKSISYSINQIIDQNNEQIIFYISDKVIKKNGVLSGFELINIELE